MLLTGPFFPLDGLGVVDGGVEGDCFFVGMFFREPSPPLGGLVGVVGGRVEGPRLREGMLLRDPFSPLGGLGGVGSRVVEPLDEPRDELSTPPPGP